MVWTSPVAPSQRYSEGVPQNMRTKGKTELPPSALINPWNIADREIKSKALMSSTDVTVVNGLISVKPWSAWATHSHPAFVRRACWYGAVATSTALPNCWAIVLATSLRITSPATIPNSAIWFRREQSCVPASPSSRIWRRPHSTVLFGVALRHAAPYCQIRVKARLLVFQSWHPHCNSGRLLQHPSNCNFQLFAAVGFLHLQTIRRPTTHYGVSPSRLPFNDCHLRLFCRLNTPSPSPP